MRIQIKAGLIVETPANLTAEVLAPQQVRLTWDQVFKLTKDDYDPEEFPGYDIRWSPDGESSWKRLVNITNRHGTFNYWNAYYGRRFYDNTIEPGTTRYYRIRAVTKNGDMSDYSEVVSATTPGLVDSDGGPILPGGVESELDALNDQKVFRILLESGQYRFRVSGVASKHRVIVTDPGGTEIENFVLVAGNGLKPRIAAQTSGEHQVKISHGGGFGNAGGGGLKAGWFQFQLVPVSDPAVGTLRLPDSRGFLAVLNSYGDVDRAEVAVQPGKAYAVRVRGRETGNGTAATPWIQRANPPGIYTDHHMGKSWVDGVTTTDTSNSICAEPGNNKAKCEEFQAFVIDLRGLTGAEQTFQIYVAPTARPGTRPYRVGTYRVELTELSSSQLQGVGMPLRAWFASPPAQHDGSKRIKVQVTFSESPENVGADGVSVEGGEVTSVRPVDSNAPGGAGTRSVGGQDEGPEDREAVWELEIEPDSDEDVTVSLAAWRPCGEPGAICTADGRPLSQGISTTVRGPDEVAAHEPPDKLTGLSATATHNQVVLTWDDPGDDSITGYVILRRVRVNNQGGDFSVLVANTESAATNTPTTRWRPAPPTPTASRPSMSMGRASGPGGCTSTRRRPRSLKRPLSRTTTRPRGRPSSAGPPRSEKR